MRTPQLAMQGPSHGHPITGTHGTESALSLALRPCLVDAALESSVFPCVHGGAHRVLSMRTAGRHLVEAMIAELEAAESQYSHIVLQATDNSISFYESLGFVRLCPYVSSA